MQTSWDPSSVGYYIDGTPRLYVLSLFFSVIWTILAFVRFCWHIHPFQVSAGKTLRRFQECLSEEKFAELTEIAEQIPATNVLGGLRVWSTLSAEQLPSPYLSSAENEFRYRSSQLRLTSQNLRRLSGFVVVFSAVWVSHQLSEIATGIQLSKQTGAAALSGAFAELFLLLTGGLSVLTFIYPVRWWMNSRLDHIEGEWERFSGRLRTQVRQPT